MAGNTWEYRYQIYRQRMGERFPELYGEDAKYAFGCFLIGEGWWLLVEALSGVIYERVYVDKYSPPVKIKHIKEKDGGLDFTISGDDEFIEGAIRTAIKLSYMMCEECGRLTSSGNPDNIERTLCPKHREIHGYYKKTDDVDC